MNKAFVREPELEGPGYCPRCGTQGTMVSSGPLDTYIRAEFRQKISDSGSYCGYSRCEVAYFDSFDSVIMLSELKGPLYPYDLDVPICACFGLTYDDVEADVQDGEPHRIRALLDRSKSPQARCGTLAADGTCCLREVQRLYMKLRSSG
ncbi:MAG: hypothetical protein O2931_06050 [Planctomycetota bacterium]|nr:hypothetical protein [Planctomycetota bacterium]MDA1178347.1 hypothetical protein [Planctomycetota bacterium]